jgi:4-alpha-glucanotransferase
VAALAAQARQMLAQPLIDRDACWSAQQAALEGIWASVGTTEQARLDAWRAARGDEIEGWARFCALAERHGADWRRWSQELRHPQGAAVARAVVPVRDRVRFHAWLQMLIEDQLDAVREVGVRVVQDLAIGVDPAGADAWLCQDLLAAEFSIGAPPDEFAPEGQHWGFPPWVPWRLRDVGYRPLANLLRSALVTGGGLRIDHAMGLSRLFWIPDGGEPRDGTYVRFEGRELLDLVALESARAQALVIGEDLGTVEPAFREELTDTGILSTRVLWFEQDPPESWPVQALAMVTTHDLPTLAGVCTGVDSPSPARARLNGLVGPVEGRSVAEVSMEVHRRLGRSPAMLAVATLEDLLGVEERPNQPGTRAHDRPNWSRALPATIEELVSNLGARRALAALAAGRAG